MSVSKETHDKVAMIVRWLGDGEDVYKRQVVCYRGQVAEFEVVHIHREALFYLLLDEIIYHCIGSVSYTHLDVYKRQA